MATNVTVGNLVRQLCRLMLAEACSGYMGSCVTFIEGKRASPLLIDLFCSATANKHFFFSLQAKALNTKIAPLVGARGKSIDKVIMQVIGYTQPLRKKKPKTFLLPKQIMLNNFAEMNCFEEKKNARKQMTMKVRLSLQSYFSDLTLCCQRLSSRLLDFFLPRSKEPFKTEQNVPQLSFADGSLIRNSINVLCLVIPMYQL